MDEQDDDDELEMGDPRAELIHRLLEYQKYKNAGEQLGDRVVTGRDVFLRGAAAPDADGPAPLADVGLFKLLDAFERVLRNVKGRIALEVTAERISIQERMTQITELLRLRRSCVFEELFESAATRYEVVVTFLAMLEMVRMHVMRMYQADQGAPIYVHYALLDADDIDEDASPTENGEDRSDPPTEES